MHQKKKRKKQLILDVKINLEFYSNDSYVMKGTTSPISTKTLSCIANYVIVISQKKYSHFLEAETSDDKYCYGTNNTNNTRDDLRDFYSGSKRG